MQFMRFLSCFSTVSNLARCSMPSSPLPSAFCPAATLLRIVPRLTICAAAASVPNERERNTSAMPVDDVILDCEMGMEKVIEHLQNELRGVRTGRASPALVEHVKVDYYGTPTDLRSIAAISVPEATQILVK